MTIPLRLQEAMDRAGIKSQSELARRSSVPQPTINRILKAVGRQGPATETLKKLAVACKVPFQWLADGTGAKQRAGKEEKAMLDVVGHETDNLFIVPKSPRIKKTAGSVRVRKVTLRPSGNGIESDVHFDEGEGEEIYLARDWLQSHGYDQEMLIAFSLIGESMAPSLYGGDILVVNLADRQPWDGAVFALNYEGTVLIRRFIRDCGGWWLCSDNADQRRFQRKQYSDRHCSIIGRIVFRFSEKI